MRGMGGKMPSSSFSKETRSNRRTARLCATCRKKYKNGKREERERERKRSGCSLVEIIARCSQSTMDTGRERDVEGDNFKSKHQAYVDLAPSICRDAQQRPQTCSGRREQSKDPQTDSDPLAIYEK